MRFSVDRRGGSPNRDSRRFVFGACGMAIPGMAVGRTGGYFIRYSSRSRESNHPCRAPLRDGVTYLTVVRAPILVWISSHQQVNRVMRIAVVSTAFPVDSPTRLRRHRAGGLRSRRRPVARGHEVTLFATADSHTSAELRSLYPKAKWPPDLLADVEHVSWALREAAELERRPGARQLGRGPRVGRLTPDLPLVYTLHHLHEPALSELLRGTPRGRSTWPSPPTSGPASPAWRIAGSSTTGSTSGGTPGRARPQTVRVLPRPALAHVKGAAYGHRRRGDGRPADPGRRPGPPSGPRVRPARAGPSARGAACLLPRGRRPGEEGAAAAGCAGAARARSPGTSRSGWC